jgi:hypothetical protein
MSRLLKGMKVPVTRVPVRYGGSPGVLAHAGAVYKILAPGKNLAPDQRKALGSLRFIPRVGPFPPAVPPAPVVAAPPPPSLLLAVPRTGRPVLTVRATGSGYRRGEAVELHACWTGSPRPGIRGIRYTWYALLAIAHANRAGSLDAVLTIPVLAQAYVSSTLRVLADDARIGNRLATAAIHVPAVAPRAPARITLRISPDHVALGQRFTVTLSGTRPRELVFFAMQPRHSTGFGGGIMGRYRADRGGIVRFAYPPFTQRWELGQWVVTAQRRGAGILASATLTVVPARAAAPDMSALRLLFERPLTHDGRARFLAWGLRGANWPRESVPSGAQRLLA